MEIVVRWNDFKKFCFVLLFDGFEGDPVGLVWEVDLYSLLRENLCEE